MYSTYHTYLIYHVCSLCIYTAIYIFSGPSPIAMVSWAIMGSVYFSANRNDSRQDEHHSQVGHRTSIFHEFFFVIQHRDLHPSPATCAIPQDRWLLIFAEIESSQFDITSHKWHIPPWKKILELILIIYKSLIVLSNFRLDPQRIVESLGCNCRHIFIFILMAIQ